MSTKDQLLHSALHGTAIRYAVEKRDLAESIAELRQIADGRDDILAEAAASPLGIGTPGRQLTSPRVDCRWNVDHGWRRQRHTARLRRVGAVEAGWVRAGDAVTQGGAVSLGWMVDCLEVEIGVFEAAATDRMRGSSGIEPVDLTTPVTPRRPTTELNPDVYV